MSADIRNTDDTIDSRDVIERIEELKALAEGEDWSLEDKDELDALESLAKQGEDYAADWEYGETLIRDSYFVTYAEELADYIGAIDRSARWPLCHIDWEAAAASLKGDYTAVEFDGVTYWVR